MRIGGIRKTKWDGWLLISEHTVKREIFLVVFIIKYEYRSTEARGGHGQGPAQEKNIQKVDLQRSRA